MEDLEDKEKNLDEDVCGLVLFITTQRSLKNINVSGDQNELQRTKDAKSVTINQTFDDFL